MVSGVEHHLAVGQDGLGFPEVHHGRGQQADAGVAVLFVVPLEKLLAESAAILDATEAIRKIRASGRYFMVRNWLSEYGLSSET